MLLENKGKKYANCFLCMLRWKIDSETKEKWIPKLRTIYGCTECKKGFHVNCFSAYHHEGALKGDTKALMDIILGSTPEKLLKGMSKICKRVSTADDLTLKSPDELYRKFKKQKESEEYTI